MYQALLTRRYLTTKIMPLLAVLAVMLCTAMVLIVWSIMGGFLTTLLGSGRTLMGDVIVSWPTGGFPHYEEYIQQLEENRDMVEAAAPAIETFGTIYLPDGRVVGVQVKGVDHRYSRVVNYEQSLWWRPLDQPLPKDRREPDRILLADGTFLKGRIEQETDAEISFRPEGSRRRQSIPRDQITTIQRGRYGDPRLAWDWTWDRFYRDGLDLMKTDPATGQRRPAAVLGTEVTGFNHRTDEGYYLPMQFFARGPDGRLTPRSDFMPTSTVLVNVFPLGRAGRPADVVSRVLPVANESRSGIYEFDRNSIFIELSMLQSMLRMDAATLVEPGPAGPAEIIIDPETGEERFEEAAVTGQEPARVTSVVIRAAKGISPDKLRDHARAVYARFAASYPGQVPEPLPADPAVRFSPGSIVIETWEDRQGTMVAAVKKEIAMVMLILLFISVTASFLILAIFWAMVNEKTKDIGILRSLGASKPGIAWLWLRYGLVIGLLGSILGGVAATAIVWNVNPIHDWIGRVFNVYVWDPKVYYFTEIPHDVEPWKAAVVLTGGLLFSVLGALIPAIRAAHMDPVRALRFE